MSNFCPSPLFKRFSKARLASLLLAATLFLHGHSDAQTPEHATLNDGPYALYTADQLEVKWLCDGQLQSFTYQASAEVTLPARCAYPFPLKLRAPASAFPAVVKFHAEKIAAFSDIHGQFDLMFELLRANHIVDARGLWIYGDGHLVVTGDVFDRGPRVTEALWLLYALEAQAQAAGGAVHLLLGNHETMVLANDLRYVHKKYLDVAQRLELTYPQLYGNDSVLGRWLRSKPVMIQVNDMLFMHGGLHPDYQNLKLSMADTNEKFRAALGLGKAQLKGDQALAFLYGSLGPLWYRGYFNPPTLASAALERLLADMQVTRLIVGHTSMDGVTAHYQGRVLAIDSGIKDGVKGEMLLWEGGRLSKAGLDGKPAAIPAAAAREQ